MRDVIWALTQHMSLGLPESVAAPPWFTVNQADDPPDAPTRIAGGLMSPTGMFNV